MSIREGGDFFCYDHNFKTNNPQKWEKHRENIPHYDAGEAPCVSCRKAVFFTGEDKIRYPGIGRSYIVKCEECKKG